MDDDRTLLTRTAYRIKDDSNTRLAPNSEPFDIRIIASTEELASDGGVILTSAWRFEKFMKNARFIDNHDLWGFGGTLNAIVAGTVVDIRVEDGLPEDKAPGGNAIVAYIRFAKTAYGQEMRTLYLDGDLDAVSVRWDHRTEIRRAPTDEEVARFGPGLQWVAVRVDLLELSAVILGADSFALALRQDADSAMALCRSKGLEFPTIDRRIDEIKEALASRAVDDGALADAINDFQQVLSAFDVWAQQGLEIRDALGGSAVAFSGLLSGDELGEELDIDNDEERSDTMVDELARTELGAIQETLQELAGVVGKLVETVTVAASAGDAEQGAGDDEGDVTDPAGAPAAEIEEGASEEADGTGEVGADAAANGDGDEGVSDPEGSSEEVEVTADADEGAAGDDGETGGSDSPEVDLAFLIQGVGEPEVEAQVVL